MSKTTQGKKAQAVVKLFADEPVPFQVTEAGTAVLDGIPSQPAAPITERAVSLVLEAETMMDADSGMLSLVASTDHHLSDFGEVSPARLRQMVEAARIRLDEFERLANEFEARDTLRAIVAEHHLHIEEWNTDTLDPRLRDKFMAFAGTVDGRKVVVVPKGQDPIVRLAVVAELVRDLDGGV